MKRIIYLLIAPLVFMSGCGSDDEPAVDPIIGKWELFNAAVDVLENDFEYIEFQNASNLFGESIYTIEFRTDQTYERILEDVPFTNGTTGNIDDEGEWELDGEDLDLNVDGTEIGGLSYSYEIEEISADELLLQFNDIGSAYPATKISEWIADGTVDQNGLFTVSEEEIDSIFNNFSQTINLVYTIQFDKE